MLNFLEKISILTDDQYGSRKKKGTIQTTISLYKTIEENWQIEAKTDCIFVDFRKPLDSVDYTGLLNKLYHIGIAVILHNF